MMLQKSSKTADKDAEITALREEVALLRASLAKVERKLANYLGEKETCDASGNATDLDQTETDASCPVFPKEIFLLIGAILKPGSRALLNLASTCQDLWQLLQPRLFEKIDSDLILLDHRFRYHHKNAKFLRKHVREVNLFPVMAPPANLDHIHPFVPASLDILAVLDNLRRLSIDFGVQPISSDDDDEGFWGDIFFQHLEVLELKRFPWELPADFFEAVPSVLREICTVDDGDIEMPEADSFWTQLSDFLRRGKMTRLNLELAADHATLVGFPLIVSRISSYVMWDHESFRTLLDMPEFQPTALRWGSGYEPERLWPHLTRLGSLKNIEMQPLKTSVMLTHGFPPNLEDADLDVIPDLGSVEKVNELRSRIPSTLRRVTVRVAFLILPAKDSTAWSVLVHELIMWSSLVTGKKPCRIHTYDCDKDGVKELEREIRKSEPRFHFVKMWEDE